EGLPARGSILLSRYSDGDLPASGPAYRPFGGFPQCGFLSGALRRPTSLAPMPRHIQATLGGSSKVMIILAACAQWSVGGYNEPIRKVIIAGIIALVALIAAGAIHLSR